MKGLMLVLALLLMASVAQGATQTAKMDVYNDHSFIGPPIVPIDPDPRNLFLNGGIDPDVDCLISRYDATSSSWIGWYIGPAPGQGTFNILLGEGYWVDYTVYGGSPPSNPTAVAYAGVLDGVPDVGGTMTDMWISLPGDQLDGIDAGGQHFISCPFNHQVGFNKVALGDGLNVQLTDGNTVRSFFDAVYGASPWLAWPLYYYNSPLASWETAGEDLCNELFVNPGRCYWVTTFKDNLAMIVPWAAGYIPPP